MRCRTRAGGLLSSIRTLSGFYSSSSWSGIVLSIRDGSGEKNVVISSGVGVLSLGDDVGVAEKVGGENRGVSGVAGLSLVWGFGSLLLPGWCIELSAADDENVELNLVCHFRGCIGCLGFLKGGSSSCDDPVASGRATGFVETASALEFAFPGL